MASTMVADKAERLASMQWMRGTSRVDGRKFWIIPAGNGKGAHYATTYGCSCKGFAFRGECSHVAAAIIRDRRDNPVRVVSEATPSLEEARDELRAALARTVDPAVRHKIIDSLEPLDRALREAHKARLRRELGMGED